jgi:hypothetical protein
MKNWVCWLLAIIITLTLSVYQRKTGPTNPMRVTVELKGESYPLKLPRTGLREDKTVRLDGVPSTADAQLHYRRYPTSDEYTTVDFSWKDDVWQAALPVQPVAGKLQYYITVDGKDFCADNPPVIRFRNDVPAGILIPHILFMFAAMLFAVYTLLRVIARKKYSTWLIVTTATLFVGGFILGPLVQHAAFGPWWTGFPFGTDLTDNKTLISFLFFLAAVATLKWKYNKWLVCLAVLLMVIIFSIPHSRNGSEYDYSAQGEPVTYGNPYLPLWEHIPDGEPYVFDDPDNPGRKRVYIYGSHDIERTMYCGRDQVVWSAPLDSLWNWRYDGVILSVTHDRDGRELNENGQGDVLYAPDICCVTNADGTKTWYLYPNDMGWRRNSLVAKSSRPDGPFEPCNWSPNDPTVTDGVMGFDPGVLVDDDGRVYGYWGFSQSFGGELDPATMATLKPGTRVVEDMVSNLNQEGIFRFFEASSIRKIKDKYVFIYSRWTDDGEFGLPGTNYTLAYAYSDAPLGPWTYGGTIIDGRGRETGEQGEVIVSATPSGNTHGSICEINGQWYVFFHRQTGRNEYARQAMVAPITVDVEEGPGGKVSISEGEYNSEGFALAGLNPLERHSAGIACWYTGPKPWRKPGDDFYSGSYLEPGYGTDDRFDAPYDLRNNMNRIVNNTAGSIVGYKYFNFSKTHGRDDVQLVLQLVPEGVDGTITVWADRPWQSQGGKVLGTLNLTADMPAVSTEMAVPLPELGTLDGKHALFLCFSSPVENRSLCALESLVFE